MPEEEPDRDDQERGDENGQPAGSAECDSLPGAVSGFLREKATHEAQQVERERRDPQEGNRGDVGADVLGDTQGEGCRDGGRGRATVRAYPSAIGVAHLAGLRRPHSSPARRLRAAARDRSSARPRRRTSWRARRTRTYPIDHAIDCCAKVSRGSITSG